MYRYRVLIFTAWRISSSSSSFFFFSFFFCSQGICLLCRVSCWAVRGLYFAPTSPCFILGRFLSMCFSHNSPPRRNTSRRLIKTAECLWSILNPGLWVTPGAFRLSKTKSKSCGSWRGRVSNKRRRLFWYNGNVGDAIVNVTVPNLKIEDEAPYDGGWLLGCWGGWGGDGLADDTVYTAVSHWKVCLSVTWQLQLLTFLFVFKKLQTLPERDKTRFNVSDSIFFFFTFNCLKLRVAHLTFVRDMPLSLSLFDLFPVVSVKGGRWFTSVSADAQSGRMENLITNRSWENIATYWLSSKVKLETIQIIYPGDIANSVVHKY